MKLIESYSQIHELMSLIRTLGKGFITNFFPEELKTNVLISQHKLWYECINHTVFFYRKNDDFINLFFFSTTDNELETSLRSIKIKDVIISDIVTNNKLSPVVDSFYKNGFEQHSILIRMSKLNKPNNIKNESNERIRNAYKKDINEIQKLYVAYFDKYAEQIPLFEELENWIEKQQMIVYELDSRIVAFLIYDINGLTLYLRYWFVHPEYRDIKIGSVLLKEFFYRGKECKRHLFWVIASNNNAIKRYEHYGFKKENMFDYILIKNERNGN